MLVRKLSDIQRLLGLIQVPLSKQLHNFVVVAQSLVRILDFGHHPLLGQRLLDCDWVRAYYVRAISPWLRLKIGSGILKKNAPTYAQLTCPKSQGLQPDLKMVSLAHCARFARLVTDCDGEGKTIYQPRGK